MTSSDSDLRKRLEALNRKPLPPGGPKFAELFGNR